MSAADSDDEFSETDALTAPSDLFSPALVGHAKQDSRKTAGDSRTGPSYAWTSLQLAVQYVWASVRRDSHSFCVGLCTVAIVVAFTGLVQSAVDNSPVVFLKLSEDTAGEGDIVMVPNFAGSASSSPGNGSLIPPNLLLNDTDLGTRLAGVPSVAGVAPRWTAFGSVLNARARSLNTSAVVLVINSELEEAIGLGRTWQRRPLGPAEAYVSVSALDEIGVSGASGQQVDVELSLDTIVASAGLTSLTSSSSSSSSTSSAAALLELLASIGLPIGTPDGQGGRSLDVNVDELIQATLDNPALAPLNLNPALLPPLGTVTINITQVLQASLNGAAAADAGAQAAGTGGAASLLTLRKRVTVVEGIEAPGGKWPAVLGNVVVLEASHAATWLGESVVALVDQLLAVLGPLEPAVVAAGGSVAALRGLESFRSGAESFSYNDLREYALAEYVVLRDRMDLYLLRPNDVGIEMARFSDDLVASLGVNYPVRLTTPLPSALESTRFIKLFLDQVFGTVVFILGLLGALVILALVLGNVEEKTYEYGMLRALGLRQQTLIKVLGVSSVSFSFPGILAGLVAASVLHGFLVLTFYLLTATLIPGVLSSGGWAISVTLGLLMPVVANVLPIRRALSSTLRDSLDLYHQTVNQVTVTLRKLAAVGVSATEAVIAVVLVLVGFTTFYFMPLTFATGQIALFLAILSVILVGMLLGLSVVGATLQPVIEATIARGVLLACRTPHLQTVVRKNLAAHRRRNSKTAYMMSMSTAFLIFAGAMFALQSESIGSNFRLFLGSDLVVFAPQQLGLGGAAIASEQAEAMPQESLSAYLRAEQARSASIAASTPSGESPASRGATVQAFTFISQGLSRLEPVVSTLLSPLTLDPSRRSSVTGVQANYLDVAFNEFTILTEQVPGDSQSSNVVRALHEHAGDLQLPVEQASEAFMPAVRELSSVPSARPVYACGADSWLSAEAQGGSAITHSTWRDCTSACSAECWELPSVNKTLADAIAASVYDEYVDGIASAAVKDPLSLSVTSGAGLRSWARNRDSTEYSSRVSLVKLRAMASKMAGFTFSPYSQLAQRAPLLVPAQAVADLLDKASAELSVVAADQEAWGDAVPPAYQQQKAMERLAAGRAGSSASDPSRNSGYPFPSQWVSGAGRSWATPDGNGPIVQPAPLDTGPENATAAVDGLSATSVFIPLPDDGSAPVLRLHPMPACPQVGGVRVWLPPASQRQGRIPLSVTVEAAADANPGAAPAASWQEIASVSLSADPTSASGSWATAVWSRPFAAPHWRVAFPSVSIQAASSPPAPSEEAARSLQLAEVELLASAGDGVCEAEAKAAANDDSTPGIPKERLMVRLYPGITGKQRSAVVNALRSRLPDDSFRVEDTAALLQAASTAVDGLNAFFYIVAGLCLVLCFFGVWLSFEGNIREGSREVGVMRSLGLTKRDLCILVSTEAVGVVLAAFLTGSVVGLAISISLTLQFNLFTQLPFVLRFPTALFIGMLVASILVAIAGSLLPLRRFLRAAIAPVAKGRLK